MLSAPASAHLAKTRNHLKLVGLGLAIWALGALACSAAPSYHLLLAARVIMGIGTGPFIAVSAPLIGRSSDRVYVFSVETRMRPLNKIALTGHCVTMTSQHITKISSSPDAQTTAPPRPESRSGWRRSSSASRWATRWASSLAASLAWSTAGARSWLPRACSCSRLCC